VELNSRQILVITLLVVLSLLVLVLWAPWLDARRAETLAEQRFSQAWQGVADGCGLDCQGCGADQAQRVLAGYLVDLEYACGLLPEDDPVYHQRARVLVSVFGTLHGLPAP
jgi:hypothetical protein